MVIERVLSSKPYHGAFIESCTHHCTSCSSTGEDSWNGPRIKSTRGPDTVSAIEAGVGSGVFTEANAFSQWFQFLHSNSEYNKFLYPGSHHRVSAQDVKQSILMQQHTVMSLRYSGPGKSVDMTQFNHGYIQDGKYPCHTCCFCIA